MSRSVTAATKLAAVLMPTNKAKSKDLGSQNHLTGGNKLHCPKSRHSNAKPVKSDAGTHARPADMIVVADSSYFTVAVPSPPLHSSNHVEANGDFDCD